MLVAVLVVGRRDVRRREAHGFVGEALLVTKDLELRERHGAVFWKVLLMLDLF